MARLVIETDDALTVDTVRFVADLIEEGLTSGYLYDETKPIGFWDMA